MPAKQMWSSRLFVSCQDIAHGVAVEPVLPCGTNSFIDSIEVVLFSEHRQKLKEIPF